MRKVDLETWWSQSWLKRQEGHPEEVAGARASMAGAQGQGAGLSPRVLGETGEQRTGEPHRIRINA